MKKWIVVIVSGLLFLIVFSLLMTVDWNKVGKDNLFIKLDVVTDHEKTQLGGGTVITRYVYEQSAFTPKGEEVRVTFTTAKELPKGTYLRLYVRDENTVTSYDIVSEKDIPKDIVKKL